MKQAKRKMTDARDDKFDAKRKIKENSSRDKAMDAKSGVPEDAADAFAKGGHVGCYSAGGLVTGPTPNMTHYNTPGSAKAYGK